VKVCVVDYQLGNIFSVCQALKYLSIDFELDTDGNSISKSKLLIIPGVAAIGAGVNNLKSSNQWERINNHFANEKPILGLCLGAQMLLDSSEEDLEIRALGFIEGKSLKIDSELWKVPNQGWNKVYINQNSELVEFDQQYFYFSHSFQMEPKDSSLITGRISMGDKSIPAIVQHHNLIGVQFHPERSGILGLNFLKKCLSELYP